MCKVVWGEKMSLEKRRAHAFVPPCAGSMMEGKYVAEWVEICRSCSDELPAKDSPPTTRWSEEKRCLTSLSFQNWLRCEEVFAPGFLVSFFRETI